MIPYQSIHIYYHVPYNPTPITDSSQIYDSVTLSFINIFVRSHIHANNTWSLINELLMCIISNMANIKGFISHNNNITMGSQKCKTKLVFKIFQNASFYYCNKCHPHSKQINIRNYITMFSESVKASIRIWCELTGLGVCGNDFIVICQYLLQIKFTSTCCKIILWWMPQKNLGL